MSDYKVKNYILDGKKPVKATLLEWADFIENENRQVARDNIDGATISTVFLGIDNSFEPSEKPILFETMIFNGGHDGYQTRCATWEEAEEMHKKAIKFVKDSHGKDTGE